MKRLLTLVYLLIFGLSLGFAQSGKIIDDLYVTPNDAQMVQEMKTAGKVKAKKSEMQQSSVYKNGAREIVFIDRHGRRVTTIPDTLYIVENQDGDTLSVDSAEQEGYYLNGFKGSKSDYEYAERIRRFHNPKYTITIADPGYNDIYFLDDDYWNVYVDGMYATITPTWTNPYWWNYQYSPYSYGSWGWRSNAWGYPSWGSYYGWGGFGYSPWYSGYYGWGSGWYDPWYYGGYGWNNYYGWGGYYGYSYPYYGGYYGWGGYPYYNGYYGYGYNTTNQTGRRNSQYAGRTINDSGSRRSSLLNTGATSSRSGYTAVSRQRTTDMDASGRGRSAIDNTSSRGVTRSTFSPDVSTRTRTGSVRTSDEWNNVRSSRSYSTSPSYDRSSSTVINRSNPSTRSSSADYGAGRSYETGRSSSSRTYDSGNSSRSSSYDTGRSSSRTYDSGSSSSRSSYDSGSSRSSSSSSGSYSGGSSGGGSSRSSSSSSGRR